MMEQEIIIGLVTGTVSGICVTLITNFITKKRNEKNYYMMQFKLIHNMDLR